MRESKAQRHDLRNHFTSEKGYVAYPRQDTSLPERARRQPRRQRSIRDNVAAGLVTAALTAGVLQTANNADTEIRWHQTDTATIREITPPSPSLLEGTFVVGGRKVTINPFPLPLHDPVSEETRMHTGIFVLGELGTLDSRHYAIAEAPAFLRFGREFSVIYPTDMNNKNTAEAINTTITKDDLTTIYLDGVSTGGIDELRDLPFINQHANGGVKINLIFDDSPIVPFDIRNQDYHIPVYLYDHGIGGSYFDKLAGEVADNVWNNPNFDPNLVHNFEQVGEYIDPFIPPFLLNIAGQVYAHIDNNPNILVNLPQQLQYALEVTNNSTPPWTWLDQLKMDATNTMQHTVKDLESKRINSIMVVQPLWSSMDHTVKDKDAEEQILWAINEAVKLRQKAYKKRIPVSSISIPGYPTFVNQKLLGEVRHAGAIHDEVNYIRGLEEGMLKVIFIRGDRPRSN